MFADDMSLVISAKNYTELKSKANSNLQLIYEWLQNNKLVPNYDKSNYIIMGCPLRTTSLSIILGEKSLQRVEHTKILGVIFDHSLKFDKHIDSICKTVSKKINFISRLRYFLPQHTLNFAYKALILPNFDYCDTIWCFTYQKYIENLVKLQKRCARVITFSDRRAHSEDLFRKLNWISVKDRFKIHAITYIYRSVNSLNANYCRNLFEFVSRFSHRTGDSLKLKFPKISCNFMKNSIFYNGVKMWNELPIDLRKIDRFTTFVILLKQELNF